MSPEAPGTHPTSTDFDVVVVGGSLAGSTAALLYGRAGLRVALIERSPNRDGFKTMCTHIVQPDAAPTLTRLGLWDEIFRSGAVRTGVDLWTRWGWIPAGDGTSGERFSLRREKLDPLIRGMAGRTPGVELRLGHRVTGLTRDGNRITGVQTVDRGGAREVWRAKLVVGADGRASDVARMAGIGLKERSNRRAAYFAYFRDLPPMPGSGAQYWFLEPDVAYTYPCDDGLMLAAYFPDKTKLTEFKRDIDGNFADVFRHLPGGPDLDRATRVGPVFGKLDITNLSRRPVSRDGIALIGDAAVASDPAVGVGCGWAFVSAELLVGATAAQLKSGRGVSLGLLRYWARHRRSILLQHLRISRFSKSAGFGLPERIVMSAAVRDAGVADALHRFSDRETSVTRFVASSVLPRAIWVNLRRASARRGPS